MKQVTGKTEDTSQAQTMTWSTQEKVLLSYLDSLLGIILRKTQGNPM